MAVADPPRPAAPATLSRRPSRRALWLLAGLPGLPLLFVVLLIVLLAGSAQQQRNCGAAGPSALPGTFTGPGSLGGVAGTGLTAAQVQAVRAGSPYAGEKITPGKYLSTAYGPPWGGIQGSGAFTSGGIALAGGNPRLYMIAVDPLVISHGTLVYAWPNPFGWRGPFLAADTGGAILSRHIDFYDWRGRDTQLRWNRNTQISARPIKTGGPDVTAPAAGELAAGGPDFEAIATAARRATGRPVGFAVADEHGTLVAQSGARRPNVGRSVSKTLILVALTRQARSRPLSAGDRERATAMIEQSDNAAASALYAQVGGRAVDRAARAAGMTGWRRDTTDPVYTLGRSTVTAGDLARLFARLDELFPARHRAFAAGLLANVQGAGRFGLLNAGLPGTVLSKGGWSPEGARGWTVNQAAQFTVAGRTYGIAVVLGGQASFAAGAAQIQRIGEAAATAGTTPLAGAACDQGAVASGPVGSRISVIAARYLSKGPNIADFQPPSTTQQWCEWFVSNVYRLAKVPGWGGTDYWSGTPYTWAKSRGLLFKAVGQRPKAATPPLGSAVMYGSGPAAGQSDHLNLVTRIYPDGSFELIGGNQTCAPVNCVSKRGPCRLTMTVPTYLTGASCDTRPVYGIAMPAKDAA